MSMSQSSALHRMAAGEFNEPTLEPTMDKSNEANAFAHVDSTPAPTSTESPAPQGSAAVRPKQTAAQQSLKALAVPLFATVGGLLLIPAVWAAFVLAGVNVWQSQRDDAHAMAIVMLVAWPIALSLLAGAVLFWWQLRQAKMQ